MPEEYNRGCFPGSINIPFSYLQQNVEIDALLQKVIFDVQSPSESDFVMVQSPATVKETTTVVIVCNSKNGFPAAGHFAKKLIFDYLLSRVCILSGGTDILSRNSMLVVP